jgi:CTP synthase
LFAAFVAAALTYKLEERLPVDVHGEERTVEVALADEVAAATDRASIDSAG